MSSVPMIGSGNIAGLSLLGCKAKSKSPNPPQAETRNVSQSHVEDSTADSSTPLHGDSVRKNGKAPRLASLANAGLANVESYQESSAKNGCGDAETSKVNGEIQRREACITRTDAKQNGAPLENGNGFQSGKPVNLHRIREVREQQGLSVRSLARRLGIDVKSYRKLEDPCYNLSLTELHEIQVALDVPFADLLVDRHGLAGPVQERAKLVKVMKSAVAIREAKSTPRVQRLAQMLCEQLTDLMPELSDVSGWPQFGARRGQSALGKALTEPIDTSQLGLSE